MAGRQGLVALVALLALALTACTSRAYSNAPPGGQVATIVPDNPRVRAWSNLDEAASLQGQVLVRVGSYGVGRFGARMQVPAGRVDMRVVYKAAIDTIEDKRLMTRPVSMSFQAQAGREYRIRGVAFPTGGARSDPAQYRVVFAVQDMSTGQIVQKVEAPTQNNVWEDTSPDLLNNLVTGS